MSVGFTGPLLAGAAAPEAIHITIDSPNIDVSGATALTLNVENLATGANQTWSTTISTTTATQVSAVHVFAADGSEVPTAGAYMVKPVLTVPGGVRRCTPVTVTVGSY